MTCQACQVWVITKGYVFNGNPDTWDETDRVLKRTLGPHNFGRFRQAWVDEIKLETEGDLFKWKAEVCSPSECMLILYIFDYQLCYSYRLFTCNL